MPNKSKTPMPRTPRRRNTAKSAHAKLLRDLSRNVDRIIDLLPKENVYALFDKKLAKKDLGLQSLMLDRAARIAVERSVKRAKPYECKRIVGEDPDVRWALFRLDSEGEYKYVDYISDEEAARIPRCG